MNDTKCTCPICGKSGLNLLMTHVTKSHKITKEEFIKSYPNVRMSSDSEKSRKSKQVSERNKRDWQNKEYRDYHTEINRQNGIKVMSNPDNLRNFLEKAQVALHSEEVLKKRSETMTHRNLENWKNKEYIEFRKICSSKTMKRQWKEDHNKMMENHFFGFKTYLYNGVYYKSSWEVDFAKLLDSAGIEFIYEDTTKLSEWVDENLKSHTYHPDFYLPEYDVLFEIKPDYKANTYETVSKIQSSKDAGYKIFLFTESDEWTLDHILELCQ